MTVLKALAVLKAAHRVCTIGSDVIYGPLVLG